MKYPSAVAVIAVVLAASGCAYNPAQRLGQYQGAAAGIAGTALVGAALLASQRPSYAPQPEGGGYVSAQPRQPVVPMGATVVECQRPEPRGTVCYAFLGTPVQPAPTAHLDGRIQRQVGNMPIVLWNGCGAGEKLPDPLPVVKPGEQVEVNCVRQ